MQIIHSLGVMASEKNEFGPNPKILEICIKNELPSLIVADGVKITIHGRHGLYAF